MDDPFITLIKNTFRNNLACSNEISPNNININKKNIIIHIIDKKSYSSSIKECISILNDHKNKPLLIFLCKDINKISAGMDDDIITRINDHFEIINFKVIEKYESMFTCEEHKYLQDKSMLTIEEYKYLYDLTPEKYNLICDNKEEIVNSETYFVQLLIEYNNPNTNIIPTHTMKVSKMKFVEQMRKL